MIDTILFDLDGTIVDTNELIIATYLHVLEGQSVEPHTRETIIPHMGMPLTEQMMFFSGRTEVEDLIKAYREFNIRMHDELVREFPHVRETLAELKRLGFKLGVVTSKVRFTTAMGLKLCKLDGFMDTIVTVDDVLKPKPDAEGILFAMRQLGADPARTLMVGDSQYDIEAAKNAGIGSVGVAWSLKGESYLREVGADYILHDMRDLLDIVGKKRDVH